MGFIDLHTHTTASDGSMTPSELVRYAEERALSAVAITDHDSVWGLFEAEKAAEGLSIEVIKGIEMSADYSNDMHILGLFIDPYAAVIQGALQELASWRAQRNEEALKKLFDRKVYITAEDVLSQKENADITSVGRVHIAKAIVNNGYAQSIGEAFEKYLLRGCQTYVDRKKFSPKRCIEIIKNSGGYAFLAHPVLSESDEKKIEVLIKKLCGFGLDGVECYHSNQQEHYSDFCVSLCKKYNLMISGGSDFHGTNKTDAYLGQTYGGRYIEEDILNNIKSKIGKI